LNLWKHHNLGITGGTPVPLLFRQIVVHPETAYLGSGVRFQNKGECHALLAAVVYG